MNQIIDAIVKLNFRMQESSLKINKWEVSKLPRPKEMDKIQMNMKSILKKM